MVLGGVPHYWSFLRKDASLCPEHRQDVLLKRKCDAYRTVTRTKKSIHTLLVSANGTEPGMYRNEINCEVTLDALFA